MDGESPNVQDERVEKLWKSLHAGETAPLDLQGLKEGLSKIEHPLANAENLLKEILKTVDTSGDGFIEYEEFRAFVKHTENELWQLFKTIDRNKDGQLDKKELQEAFARAGLDLDNSKLARFFDEVDTNHDGTITFAEWRDFLLFLPTHSPNLKVVLSYYSSAISVNPEGDVHVSGGGATGLGINFLFSCLFGVIFEIANYRLRKPAPESDYSQPTINTTFPTTSEPNTFPWDPGEDSLATMPKPRETEAAVAKPRVHSLTTLLPESGYFLAGAAAGCVSRTATAPLDRLKVYLIAQTNITKEAVDAVKTGAPIEAAKKAGRPLVEATLALWRMGGIRSLFAGNGLNVLKVMPESAIKFGSYEGTKRVLARFEGHGDPSDLGPWSQFLAAGTGGVISQFAVYPLDTLKFRMQNETVQGGSQGNKLIVETAKKMVADKGVRSFYRGLWLGLGGMFPYSAIDLTTYEYLRKFVTSYNKKRLQCSEKEAKPGGMMTGGIGAVSSSFGASIVYPVNVIRTRLQAQGTAIHPSTYDGWRDCFQKTVKKEGLRGLYKGLIPNLLKVVPSMSISYMTYEASKKVLELA